MSGLSIQGSSGSVVGRYLLSAGSVEAGQLVLREEVFITGPRLSAILVCVQCLHKIGDICLCRRCGLPLCQSCQSQPENSNSVHKAECLLLQANDVKLSPRSVNSAKLLLSAVTVLRLLLSDGWMELEDHMDKRRNGEQWRLVERQIIPVLGQLRDKNENILFSQELIQQAAGVLDTNCFELKTLTKSGSVLSLGRALFLQAALFNNSCQPNCRRRVVGSTIEVTTIRAVSAGEELTICYADLLQPTHIRQNFFWQTKFFLCQCGRCRDPSERGSYLTSVRCGECDGAVLQEQCELCERIVSPEEELCVHDECEHLLKTTDWADCQAVQNTNTVLRSALTTHHHLLVQCKQGLLHHAGRCKTCRQSPLYACSRQEMERLREILLPGSEDLAWGEGGSLK